MVNTIPREREHLAGVGGMLFTIPWNGVHDRGGGRMAAGDELTVAAYAGRFLPRSNAGAEREDLHVEAVADHPVAVEQPERAGAVPGAVDVGRGGIEVPSDGAGGGPGAG